MKHALILVIFTCVCIGNIYSKTGAGHRADILNAMFSSTETQTTRDLADYISQGIDMGSGGKPIDLSERGSSYLNTIKQNYKDLFDEKLKGIGPHRTLGHWSLDGSIPRQYLDLLDEMEKAGKLSPGARKLFIDNWREFVYTRTEAVKQVFNLSGPNSDRAARSFASMIGDVHNIGDWTTTDCRGLRNLDQVVDDYCRSSNRLLGKNNNMTKAIKAEMKPIFAKCNNMDVMKAFRKLPQGFTDAQKAEKILEFAKSMPDKEFNDWMLKNIKGLKGEDRINAILNMPKRFSQHKIAGEVLEVLQRHSKEFSVKVERIFRQMGFDGNLRHIDWARLKVSTKAWKASNGVLSAGVKGVHANGARVREILINGKKVKVVDIPVVVENGKMMPSTKYLSKNVGKIPQKAVATGAKHGAKSALVKGSAKIAKWLGSSAGQGVSSGVLSFAIKEGETIVAYSQGKIESDTFNQRTAFNVGVAATEGCAVYLIAGATAGAPVAVTVGAFIVAGIVIEKAGEYVWYRIDREVGIFPGINIDELFFEVDESVKMRRTMLDDLESLQNGIPVRAPIPYSNL